MLFQFSPLTKNPYPAGRTTCMGHQEFALEPPAVWSMPSTETQTRRRISCRPITVWTQWLLLLGIRIESMCVWCRLGSALNCNFILYQIFNTNAWPHGDSGVQLHLRRKQLDLGPLHASGPLRPARTARQSPLVCFGGYKRRNCDIMKCMFIYRYYSYGIIPSRMLFNLANFVSHTIPGYFLDGIAYVSGRKQMCVNHYSRTTNNVNRFINNYPAFQLHQRLPETVPHH